MKYYIDNKKALSDLISDLENDNGILLIAKEDVESELDYASNCHSLEEQLGCPLEIRLQVVHNAFIYDAEGNEYVVEFIEKDFFSVYNIFYMSFRWSDYKNTWFLKKDKSE